MATGGSKAAEVTSQNQREALTCALCLDVFREPKLLPCSHTFCLKCLKDLVDQAASTDDSAASGDGADVGKATEAVAEKAEASSQAANQSQVAGANAQPENPTKKLTGKSFPCPACRKEIQMPKGGAAAFRVNLDIDPAELESLRDDTHCSVHQEKDLEILCADCDLLICVDCKQNTHYHHRSKTLEDAVDTAKTQLSEQKPRLQGLLADLEKNMKKRERSQKYFQAKNAVVEREIRQRYSKILAEIEKYRDDAIAALQSSRIDVESTSNKELDDVRRNLDEARYLCQRIEQAETKGEGCKLVTVAKEMTSGSGSEAAVEKLEEVGHMTEVRQPVHRSVLPVDDAVFKTLKDFVGTCELVAMKCDADEEEKEELESKEQLKIGDHDDVTVYCVKSFHNGSVDVSFDPFYNEKQPVARRSLDEKGESFTNKSLDSENQFGQISFTEVMNTSLVRKTNGMSFYAKTLAATNAIFALSHSGGSCSIDRNEFTVNPLKKEKSETVMTFQSRCRAMDVGISRTRLVVVAEPDWRETQRKVKLFNMPASNNKVWPSDTYRSPLAPFQPTDVCFYTLQGQEVLLIADEANDAIHVVEVKDNKMTFTRFLCPGCPLLLQPTALNTDYKGRLWVGCRGGRLITFQTAVCDDEEEEEEDDDDEEEEQEEEEGDAAAAASPVDQVEQQEQE